MSDVLNCIPTPCSHVIAVLAPPWACPKSHWIKTALSFLSAWFKVLPVLSLIACSAPFCAPRPFLLFPLHLFWLAQVSSRLPAFDLWPPRVVVHYHLKRNIGRPSAKSIFLLLGQQTGLRSLLPNDLHTHTQETLKLQTPQTTTATFFSQA